MLSKEVLDHLHKKYRDSSIKTMKSQLNSYIRKLNLPLKENEEITFKIFKENKDIILANLNEIITKTTSKTELSSKVNVVKSICAIDIEGSNIFNEMIPKLKKSADILYKKTKSKWLDRYSPLEVLEKEYYKKVNTMSILSEKIIGLLYISLPPLRGQDYFTVIIGNIKDSKQIENNIKPIENIYNPITHEITLNNYKTSSSHGKKIILLPKIIYEELDKYHQMYSLTSGNYMLSNTQGNQYKEQNWNRILTKIFGISVDILRNIYISEMLDYLSKTYGGDKDSQTILYQKRLAEFMGHTTATQSEVYSNLSLSNIKFSDTKFLKSKFELFLEASSKLDSLLISVDETKK